MNLWTSVTDMINKTVENQTFPFELVAQRLYILVNTGSKEHAERNRIFYSLKIKCHLIISTRTHVNITVETNIWLMCVCVSFACVRNVLLLSLLSFQNRIFLIHIHVDI